MTVSSTTNKIIYDGDGSTTVFPYNFKIFADTDLEVTLVTVATGAEEILTLTSDYSVSDAGEESGGNVTTVSTYSSAYKLVIKRVPPQTQTLDYQENDDFPSQSTENALDKLTFLIQDLDEKSDRAIKQAITESTDLTFPSAEATKAIAWNATGDGLENIDSPTTAAAAAEAAQTAAEAAQALAETAQTGAETAETNAETAETNAAASAVAAAASAASINRLTGTFVDGDLTAGVLTVTHNFGLSAPYSVNVGIYDNSSEMIGGVDSVTGSANSVAIDMTSFGTLTGTWGYVIGG
jgi:hypothetical protein